MIVCAGKIESFEYAFPIGIGLIESAINLTQLCLLDKPNYLFFVGSAGSYGGFSIGDIVTSDGASNIENSNLLGKSYTPLDNVLVSNSGIVSHETIVNSSNYITADEAIGRLYQEHKIGIENMEFFSVIRVAKEFNIPVAGAFVITNYCNKEAHKEFLNNHKSCIAKLDNYMREHFLIRK